MNGLRLVPVGYNQIDASGTGPFGMGQGLTGNAPPARAKVAIISVETAAIRWRDDGTAPSSSVGMPIAAAAVPFEYWGNLAAFSLIKQTGSPVVNVAFYDIAG